MPYLPLTSPDAESPEVREQHDYWTKRAGRVTNMKSTLLNHPPTYHIFMTWYELFEEVVELVGARAAHLYCYAISTSNQCLVCSTYFRQILVDAGEDPSTFEPSPLEQLLLRLGTAISTDANNIPDDVYTQLKEHFTDSQIVLILGFGAQMVATNLFNMLAKVEVDEALESYLTPEFLALVATEDA